MPIIPLGPPPEASPTGFYCRTPLLGVMPTTAEEAFAQPTTYQGQTITAGEARALEDLARLIGTPPSFQAAGGRVTGTLDLSGKGLTSLPESLGSLTSLKKLELHHNRLTALPESVGRLSSLETLYLSFNPLTSLPESLGQMSSLTRLWLKGNQLTSLPESIGNIHSLQTLWINNNQLTSLPESIGQLSSLQKLKVYNNMLPSLPESIGHLSSLQTLDLSSNKLTALPESIGRLSSLRELWIHNNNLTSLPESVGRLSSLRDLKIYNNNLTSLPESTLRAWLTAQSTGAVVVQRAIEGVVGESGLVDQAMPGFWGSGDREDAEDEYEWGAAVSARWPGWLAELAAGEVTPDQARRTMEYLLVVAPVAVVDPFWAWYAAQPHAVRERPGVAALHAGVVKCAFEEGFVRKTLWEVILRGFPQSGEGFEEDDGREEGAREREPSGAEIADRLPGWLREVTTGEVTPDQARLTIEGLLVVAPAAVVDPFWAWYAAQPQEVRERPGVAALHAVVVARTSVDAGDGRIQF